jgi:tetratricopeptide (TPR) repeat protein
MRILLLTVLIANVACGASFTADTAADFAAANKFYEQGKFADASAEYEKLLQSGSVSPALLFNLGNAFYKSGQIGRAIGAYRQAERLTPRDPDLRANLHFARNQVQGPTTQPDRWQRWLDTLTVNEWTVLAGTGFWLFFGLLALGQWQPAWQRRLRVYAAAIGGATLLLAVCLGFALRERERARTAIVVAREAVVRAGPLDESPSVFVVHDGAEMNILDHKDDWLQVSDGGRRTGWLKRDAVLVLGGNSI